MSSIRRVPQTLGLLAVLLLCEAANAGPPLICHPFVTGSDPLLPWVENTHNWFSPDHRYGIENLTADTLELLTPDAPILARMENLRRAALYASMEPRVATELLTAVLGRIDEARDAHAAAMASFDAGYLLETYRQVADVDKGDLLAEFARRASPAAAARIAKLDAHGLVRDAQRGAPALAAELEFAASLMSYDNEDARRRRERAAALTPAGSLLERNLEHWD
jgi:hypothetical protein